MTEILNKPVTHTFTHFHLVLTIVKATVAGVPPLESGEWLAVEALPQKAWSTLMKKVLGVGVAASAAIGGTVGIVSGLMVTEEVEQPLSRPPLKK